MLINETCCPLSSKFIHDVDLIGDGLCLNTFVYLHRFVQYVDEIYDSKSLLFSFAVNDVYYINQRLARKRVLLISVVIRVVNQLLLRQNRNIYI